jgi:hypothetical protein
MMAQNAARRGFRVNPYNPRRSPIGHMRDAGSKSKVSAGAEKTNKEVIPTKLIHKARVPIRFSWESVITGRLHQSYTTFRQMRA